MGNEKKVKLNGYHIVPHEISILDRRTSKKFIQKKKMTIASAFLEVINDYYMQNDVSYNIYYKKWRWHWREVKEFLNHIGLTIETKKNQYSFNQLKLSNPKKSSKYPDEIVGIVHKIFGEPFGEALEKHLENNKKEEEFINRRIHTNREFQKFWNFYLNWTKNNPTLAVSDISVKKAKNNYHALIEEEILTPEEILQLTKKYLLKCQVFQSKAKSPANFLDELFEQEARDMLRNYDIVDSLTLKNENLHIYFDFNKKDRFIFKYKDSALNTDQVLKVLKRELPGKSDNEIIELINSFRAYLNKFKHSGLVDVKQYFFDFLREEVE